MHTGCIAWPSSVHIAILVFIISLLTYDCLTCQQNLIWIWFHHFSPSPVFHIICINDNHAQSFLMELCYSSVAGWTITDANSSWAPEVLITYREWWQHEGEQIWESRNCVENFWRQNVVRLYLQKQKIEHWKRCAAAMISVSVPHSPDCCIFWRCSVYIWSVLPSLINCCLNFSCRSGWVMWFIIYDRMIPCWDWSLVMPYASARKKPLLRRIFVLPQGKWQVWTVGCL